MWKIVAAAILASGPLAARADFQHVATTGGSGLFVVDTTNGAMRFCKAMIGESTRPLNCVNGRLPTKKGAPGTYRFIPSGAVDAGFLVNKETGEVSYCTGHYIAGIKCVP